MQIKRRHVIYVQGYDPRGLAQYYRMFRTELRKFLGLYNLKADITRPELAPDNARARWTITTQADDWQTHTTYDFLRWEDVIAKDFTRAPLWVIVHGLITLADVIRVGMLFRFFKAHWRFALFVLYPYVALIAQCAVAIWLGLTINGLAATYLSGGFIPVIAGLIAGAGVLFAMIKWLEPRTYMLYLMTDIVSTRQFARNRRPDWTARMQLFAQHLADIIRASDADEAIIIGHSSGSFLAVDVLAQALRLDPDLGRHGPKVRLLTLGGNLPIIGLAPKAQWFRDELKQLAIEPSVDWYDFQSRKDVMNFFPFDAIGGHGIDVGAARRNPTLVRMRLRKLIDPKIYPTFRWRFFRVHFQFIMANDRPDAYDFYMMLCGPVALPDRVNHPDDSVIAVTGDPPARLGAWQRMKAGKE